MDRIKRNWGNDKRRDGTICRLRNRAGKTNGPPQCDEEDGVTGGGTEEVNEEKVHERVVAQLLMR